MSFGHDDSNSKEETRGSHDDNMFAVPLLLLKLTLMHVDGTSDDNNKSDGDGDDGDDDADDEEEGI